MTFFTNVKDYALPVIPNALISLDSLISGKPLKRFRIDDEHQNSLVRQLFSPDEKARALTELQNKFDTTYYTKPDPINAIADEHEKAQSSTDRFSETKLSPDLLEEATNLLPPQSIDRSSPPLSTMTNNSDITIEVLHAQIKAIKTQLDEQLKKDIEAINDASFSEMKLQAQKPPMTAEELKKQLIQSLNDSHKNTVDKLNHELEEQYKIAENDHNMLLILAMVLKNDEKMNAKFLERSNTTPPTGGTTSPGTLHTGTAVDPSSLSKLDRTLAERMVFQQSTLDGKKASDRPWFPNRRAYDDSQPFITTFTGNALRTGQTDAGQPLYRMQFPTRLPCGPVTRLLADLLFDVKLTGSSFYYLGRQDLLKLDYLEMANRLRAEGYEKATIKIDYNPSDPDNAHLLEHAQAAFAASCEAGFQPENLTFILNNKKVPLFDKIGKDNKVEEKGIYQSKEAMQLVADNAAKKHQKQEELLSQPMKDLKKEVQELREKKAAEAAKQNAASDDAAQSATPTPQTPTTT